MLLVLARQFGPDDRDQLDANYSEVERLTVRELERFLTEVDGRVTDLRRILRARITPPALSKLLREALERPEQLLFLPKFLVLKWVPGLEDAIPALKDVPEGARLSFDVWGMHPKGHPGELRILEAALFEDMALHFNQAISLDRAEQLPRTDTRRLTIRGKLPLKRKWASLRAALTSAFFTLEAYLNSIAFDHLQRHGDTLTEKDLTYLTEGDAGANAGHGRERYLSLREKLLQYQRIILGVAHAPLQENNCEALRIVVGHSKRFRDAVVHASPKTPTAPSMVDKEQAFLLLDLGTVATVIDATVELIEAIETQIHGTTRRLFWLQRRTAEGVFPDSAFA